MIYKVGKAPLMIYQSCGLDKKILFAVRTEFFGGDGGDRTHDLLNAIQALSQLSYAPEDKKYNTTLQSVLQVLFF